MKILFISQFYPPEIGAASNRIGYFAHFLAKKGHEVTVLTGAPNYPEGKIYTGHKNRLTISTENGVTVCRTWIFLSAKKNTLSRLAHYISFIFSSIMAKRKLVKPDVIIATSPPLFVGIIGVIFKKIWGSPLVLDIRDIWPESVQSVGAVKNKRLLAQGQRLANWIYKHSDRITATSPGIQKKLPHIPAEKISIIPNGAEFDLFDQKTDPQSIQKMWNLENRFTVLYAGNLGLAQAPETIIKAAKILKNEQDIVFLIVGSGVLFGHLEKEARKENLTNVIFAGVQPRSKMPHFIAASDVCLIPYKAADTFRCTLPSKMFDYMAGAKPIIINLQGEAGELIMEAHCGLIAKEEDAKDLAERILELKNNPDKAKEMGVRGRRYAEENYRREVIAEKLERLLWPYVSL